MPQSEKIKYLVVRGQVIPLFHSNIDNLWRDLEGTIFALRDDAASVDPIDRCGVGIFSLPAKHSLTASCKPHDFAYTSPAYQLFHTRKEADEMLAKLVKFNKYWGWLAEPFYYLSRVFGSDKWENPDTNV